MRRLALTAVAGLVLAGCGSKVTPRPIVRASTSSATVSDPRGDAVDADGNPRRGRPDVDIVRVGIDRNSDRTLFTISTAGKPRGPVVYEVFAQTTEVAGYDIVNVTRDRSGVSGYVAFENSVARQTLSAPRSLSVNGPTLAINVPIDPVFGATPFQWRLTVRTDSGARISDVLPSPSGLKTFPVR
jgi:hypothetical protein